MVEAGLPGVSIYPWVAVFGPAGMPTDVVQRLSREFNAITGRADIGDNLNRQGFVPVGSTPAELGELVKTQLEGGGAPCVKPAFRRIDLARKPWMPGRRADEREKGNSILGCGMVAPAARCSRVVGRCVRG